MLLHQMFGVRVIFTRITDNTEALNSNCQQTCSLIFRTFPKLVLNAKSFPENWLLPNLSWLLNKGVLVTSFGIHSPREIISTVCDFPYKIIEKCFQ